MPTEAARILIADSDAQSRRLAATALRREGYEVREAATGEEALEAARKERPAVAILDVALPGMSGYDVCRTLRKEYGDALPIVLVSGHPAHALDRIARALVGTDDYLVKAVSPREMLSILSTR